MSEISNHSETVADLQGRIALLAEKDDRKAAAIREISERSAILSNYSDIVADLKERVVLLNEKVEKQAAEIPDLFIKSVGSSLKETTKTNTFTHKKNRPATTDAGLPVAEVSADVWDTVHRTYAFKEYDATGLRPEGIAGLYKVPMMLLERFLNSNHRTNNIEEADYYFVPLLDMCMHGRSGDRAKFLAEGIQYIRKHWKYWDLYPERHLLTAPGDHGACTYQKDAVLSRAAWLVHWGLRGKEYGIACTQGDGPACYVPGKDVVLPAFLAHESRISPDVVARSPLMRAHEPGYVPPPRTHLLYLAGSLSKPVVGSDQATRDCPYAQMCKFDAPSSADCLKALSGFGPRGRYLLNSLVDGRQSYDEYLQSLASSIFCFAPAGHGWGQRMTLAVMYGCIPVIMQDNVTVAFEEDLPFSEFALRVPNGDLDQLDGILTSLTPVGLLTRCPGQHRKKRLGVA
eukprot:gene20169-24143_t